jgi:hypothetical protein
MVVDTKPPPVRNGRNVWVTNDTYEDLVRYRHGGETMDAAVQRLIRFAKRWSPVARVNVEDEFLP